MALQHANNLVSEKFFLAVSNGSVASLKEIVAENEPDVVAEIVQSKNSQGETPLLVAIREQHFEMVKYLVDDLKADIGQMGLVWNGLTNMTVPPLFAAINYYYPKLAKQDFQIAIYLMDQDTVNESSVVLNSVKSSNIPLQDKMDILKFIGATHVLTPKEEDDSRFLFGKICWREAMALRTQSSTTIPKMTKFYEWAKKVRGIGDSAAMDEMLEGDRPIAFFKLEALIIIEKIGSRILRGPHPFFLSRCLQHYHSLLIENPSHTFDLLMLILEELRADDEWEVVNNSEWAKHVGTATVFDIFRISKQSRHLPRNDPRKITFGCLMDVLRYLSDFNLKILQTSLSVNDCVVQFVKEMLRLDLEESERREFEQWLGNYIGDINGHSGVVTLLHDACKSKGRLQLIPLLLNAGANPAAADQNGWAPLHYLIDSFTESFPPWQHQSTARFPEGPLSASVQLLLDAKAHMDQLNSVGETPFDFCKSRLRLERPDPHLDVILSKVLPFSLRCLCAQVISRNKIPFVNKLPTALQIFVVKHGAQM